MFGFKKNDKKSLIFDPETQCAVVRSSICTGEKVAGFKDLDGSHFIDVCIIRNDQDLENFKKRYNVTEVKTEY